MAFTRKPVLLHCGVCNRLVDSTSLTDLWPAPNDPRRQDPNWLPEPLRICPAGGCWSKANADGYMTEHQRRGENKLADGTYYSPPA